MYYYSPFDVGFVWLGPDFLRFRSGDLRAPACLGPDSVAVLVGGLSSTATAGATSPKDCTEDTGVATATGGFSDFGFLATAG